MTNAMPSDEESVLFRSDEWVDLPSEITGVQHFVLGLVGQPSLERYIVRCFVYRRCLLQPWDGDSIGNQGTGPLRLQADRCEVFLSKRLTPMPLQRVRLPSPRPFP